MSVEKLIECVEEAMIVALNKTKDSTKGVEAMQFSQSALNLSQSLDKLIELRRSNRVTPFKQRDYPGHAMSIGEWDGEGLVSMNNKE